jgi:methionyl aminopeptidase
MGQRQEYLQAGNAWRRESAEAKARESLSDGMYAQLRQAGEAHRQVRMWARGWIKPGMRMVDIADAVEDAMRKTIGAQGLERGIAFPCGLSRNNCAAHWTPNAGDTTVLGERDVLKVDIGLHVGGRIVDSAFTLAWDPQFDGLLAAVREATDAGVAACGVDVRLGDIGAAVQEVMESHEVTINGKTHKVKSVRNLFGHTLGMYQVHAGKSIPIVKGAAESDRERLEEGDLVAIETFGSTGHGFVQDDLETSHYMKAFGPVHSLRGGPKARELLSHIGKNYGTLAFARRWLDQAGVTRYALALKSLVDAGAVNPYPPLCDVQGSYVAQFEHTVGIKSTCKEVFSRGDDY